MRLHGLRLRPPGTGALTLTFDQTGKLQAYHAMVGRPYTTLGGYAMGFTQEPGYYMASPFLSVTTTGAVVHDPTGFWDTMDMAVLTKEHTRMQVLHDLFRE